MGSMDFGAIILHFLMFNLKHRAYEIKQSSQDINM